MVDLLVYTNHRMGDMYYNIYDYITECVILAPQHNGVREYLISPQVMITMSSIS